MSRDFCLFTTVRIEAGHCTLLPLHLDVLAASARTLGFSFDRTRMEHAMEEIAATWAAGRPAKLRFVLDVDGTWTHDPMESLLPDAGQLEAFVWDTPMNSDNPLLRHKTTHRPVYDRAIREAHASGFIDAIFHNEKGLVTEGATHSVFVRHGDLWRTPSLAAGVLPGVYRQHLLETMSGVSEADISLAELASADEVWLTNAIRGARKVTVKPFLPATTA